MPFWKAKRVTDMSRSERLDRMTRKEGLRHTMYNLVGDKYIGEWKNNLKSGKGRLVTRHFQQYEGDFLNGYRHGFGVLSVKIPETDVYTLEYRGEWKNGRMHGEGTRIYPIDGSFYIGNWVSGKRHGYGQLWLSNGDYYDGQWNNDSYAGEGIFILACGNRYEGLWKDGLKHGKGRFFHLDTGQMQEGVWFENKCIYSYICDIPYRQSSKWPTDFPITKIKLVNTDEVCKKCEEKALTGESMVCTLSDNNDNKSSDDTSDT